jgi:hypothetical protein
MFLADQPGRQLGVPDIEFPIKRTEKEQRILRIIKVR